MKMIFFRNGNDYFKKDFKMEIVSILKWKILAYSAVSTEFS